MGKAVKKINGAKFVGRDSRILAGVVWRRGFESVAQFFRTGLWCSNMGRREGDGVRGEIRRGVAEWVQAKHGTKATVGRLAANCGRVASR